MMTPTVLRAAFRGLALGGVVMLGACNGVGEGIAPVSSVLLPAGGAEGDATLKAYSCLNTTLTLIVDFSNGARGDFTSRAKWSSSNPDVVMVSNGDVGVPDEEDLFFSKGVLIPKKAGSAVISAQYLDFKNTITVTVGDPTNFKITPDVANLAVGSVLDLGVSADLDGKSTTLDSSVTWAFRTPADTIAMIAAATGLITGKAESVAGQLLAEAKVPNCSINAGAGLVATAEVNVSPLQTLAISKEFAGADKLVVGTTERITATGTLANGATQNLAGQVAFTATDTTSPAPSTPSISFLFGTLSNLILANAASTAPTNVQASFGADAAKKTSNTIQVTAISATLNSVTVTPDMAEVEPGATVQLNAAGGYVDAAMAPFTQDISRHVSWTSSDTTNFLVQTSGTSINPIAGLALAGSAAAVGTSTTVTATSSTATGAKTDTAIITVVADTP